jgi:hypothetical protein
MLRVHCLSLTLLLVLTLVGCGSPSLPRALGSPSVFASAEEALAAAIVAYGRAVEVGDLVGQDGGRGSERFEEVAIGDYLESATSSAAIWVREGYVQVGLSRFRDVRLVTVKAGPERAVMIDLCHDVTGTDVVGSDGRSIVPGDRDGTLHFRVDFTFQSNQLLVAGVFRLDDQPC